MNTNFDKALAFTLADEGGNVDDKADRGGRTSRGVTQRTFDAAVKKYGWPSGDVFRMTDAQAKVIYANDYWTPTGCPTLAVGLDYSCFDWSVNSGVKRGKAAGAKYMALDTVAAIQAVNDARTSFVNAIAGFARFRKGVLARVARVEARSLKMVTTPSTVSIVKNVQFTAEKKAKYANTAVKTTGTGAAASTVTAPATVDWHSMAQIVTIGAIVAVLVGVTIYFAYKYAKHSARADALASV